ncbi:MAG: hypothetical protein FWE35_27640, partial [Streptosporangiales bacterium]|nr:hypothetical protein [Streptosporangiales bacterium]
QAAGSVPVAFGIARAHPQLLAAARDSFLDGLTIGCVVVAGLCYLAAIAGVIALPGAAREDRTRAPAALQDVVR